MGEVQDFMRDLCAIFVLFPRGALERYNRSTNLSLNSHATDDAARVAFLFALYQTLTAPLMENELIKKPENLFCRGGLHPRVVRKLFEMRIRGRVQRPPTLW